MKNLEEILLLGDINIDTIWPVAKFPVPGRDGLAPTVEVEIGGAVVNSALVLDNLGLRVSLIGSTGQDVWAQYVIQKLSDTDIGLSRVHDKPGVYTGLTFIIVTPDGERTMFSHRGANINLEVQDIDKDAFEHACMLHISGYALMESPQRDAVWRAVELAKENNIHISLDTGLEPAIQRP
jgi:ribokinase